MSVALADERLLRTTLFCDSGKDLLAEYFKFQQTQKDDSLLEFEFLTYEAVSMTLDKLSTHIQPLACIQKVIELESLFSKKHFSPKSLIHIVVFFAMFSTQIITKDALSKVSRSFFKEFKMNYRRYPEEIFPFISTLLKFFDCSPLETVKTFFVFNVIILCETLAVE